MNVLLQYTSTAVSSQLKSLLHRHYDVQLLPPQSTLFSQTTTTTTATTATTTASARWASTTALVAIQCGQEFAGLEQTQKDTLVRQCKQFSADGGRTLWVDPIIGQASSSEMAPSSLSPIASRYGVEGVGKGWQAWASADLSREQWLILLQKMDLNVSPEESDRNRSWSPSSAIKPYKLFVADPRRLREFRDRLKPLLSENHTFTDFENRFSFAWEGSSSSSSGQSSLADEAPQTTLDNPRLIPIQGPIVPESRDSNEEFQVVDYFHSLHRYSSQSTLGNHLLYADTVSSTQTLLDK